MADILDFSKPLDVALFDEVVTTFFFKSGPAQIEAGNILQAFDEHPDAWKRVEPIMTQSQVQASKFIALQVLEKLIKTMWKALPADQRDGIKNFVVQVVVELSSDENLLKTNASVLPKLNITLVQILKQEWPHNWPTFIPEIVSSSKKNLSLCENNMVILKLLSEEIFDYSAEQMTQTKTKNLKNQMCNEFSEIFQLCFEILQQAEKPSLIKATLETLLRFLNWIPLGYIFQTNLIDILRSRFLEVREFRNVTLKCLLEIGALQVGPEYNDKFAILFTLVIPAFTKILPLNQTNIVDAYDNSDDEEQQFIQNLGLFLTSFLGAHLSVVEVVATQPGSPAREMLSIAHQYLLAISLVEDREVFKVCLEYWQKLVSELYEETQVLPTPPDMPVLNLGGQPRASFPATVSPRKDFYADTLSKLRVVMIERMAKPEEVLIVENDEGEIVREELKESDTIVLYKSMREVLVYLAHLDTDDTERIMSQKLHEQMDESQWSWTKLNKLCWAIGSISGAMSEEAEKKFLVMVIKELLGLVEMKSGKDNKAVVASNIMYIVGQYPRFLKAHWKFLKTVVNKLFEFMHELHEGVQDMACDTFIKIAQKCKRHFVIQQPHEIMPYIEEILNTIDAITSDLAPQQIHTFYEAVGYMISAQPNKVQQERLIGMLMRLPNQAWDNVMQQATTDPTVLNNPENIKMLGNIMKTNVAACSSIGAPFICQIGRIYMDLLALYKAVSGLISQQVVMEGEIATKTPRVRGFRTIKREILKLVEKYVSKADDLAAVTTNMIPPLLETVLGDYARNVEPAKDAEVLNTMASIVGRLGDFIADKVPPILDAVFECTLNMINKNFEEYPEHRVGFFRLLQAINQACFPALLNMPAPQFRLYLDSVVWAFKHTMRDISDMGLSIILELLNNVSKTDTSISNAFYQTYYISILQDIFFVLTNAFHKSGFKLQSMILLHLFEIVDTGKITAPLFDPTQVPNPAMTNQEFVREYVKDLLKRAFPHLQSNQLARFVNSLFEHKDFQAFKGTLRDFLITLKEFGEDNSDLYLDERESEAAKKAAAEREAALRIPGMVKPHDRPDAGDDGMAE
ncbi:Karyopherin transporter [Borealophlyctis nickersoniae]|nr:Karyopherin transporter [Borealophlyctis nickersoniae]